MTEKAERICRALGLYPNPEDHETFELIVEAIVELDLLKYRETHFHLLKAAHKIMNDHSY